MNQEVIVIDNAIPYIKGVFDNYASLRYLPAAAINNETVKDATALIIRTRTRCDERLLADSKVRFIATATIGFDHIDADYCAAHNIRWTNAPGCNAGAVVQYVFSAIVGFCNDRHLDLRKMTMGIVGVGNVGRRVEAMAHRLGMRVLVNDPPRAEREGGAAFCSLKTIFDYSDIVTVHTPITQSGAYPTYHLLGGDYLMKSRCAPLIINAARGGVVDEAALIEALDYGTVSGCVIDCWEGEPRINRELLQYAYYATPHIAGYSADGKANATQNSIRAVAEFFNIEMLKDFRVTALDRLDAIVIDDNYPVAQWNSYDISKDSQTLKSCPEMFEQLRTDYVLRREVEFVMKSSHSVL